MQDLPPRLFPILGTAHEQIGNPTTEEGHRLLRAQSPLFAAEHIQAPLWIYHGAQDSLVKPSQTLHLVQRLQELGKPVECRILENEAHGFQHAENEISVYEDIEKFLSRTLAKP